MGSKYKTTVDQIESLLGPEDDNSDEDFDLETRAKVVEEFQEDICEEPRFQRLKQSIVFDDDPRYSGRKASRKVVRFANESFAYQIQQYNPEDGILSIASGKSSEESEIASDEEGDISGEGSEDEGDKISGEGNKGEDEGDENNHDNSFQHISKKDGYLEVEKGRAVKNQLNLWDKLLECRIRMQKFLSVANQFPQYNTFNLFEEQGGQDFISEVKKNTSGIQNLLDKLVHLQHIQVNSYSETKSLNAKVEKGMDEEIRSDTESETDQLESTKQLDDIHETHEPPKKYRCVDDYEEILAKNHKNYLEYRNKIIQKWNDRTRIASGKMNSRNFSDFEQSTLHQIEQVLSNRNRLIQRTRQKRSVPEILGESAADETKSENLTDYNPEIFDDSDFYQQLLRELIERRAGDERDPAALGRRWAVLQQMRSRMKRRIDVRATKGRRVRYNPHVKLVGFMAPQEHNTWTDQASHELFSSLFGSCAS